MHSVCQNVHSIVQHYNTRSLFTQMLDLLVLFRPPIHIHTCLIRIHESRLNFDCADSLAQTIKERQTFQEEDWMCYGKLP